MVFDPATEMMKCPACARTEQVAIPAGAHVAAESFEAAMRNDPSQLEKLSETALQVTCPGCGSVIEFQPPQVAGACPFCAAQIVTQPVAADARIAPSAVLPFHVDKRAASTAFRGWISSRWFAPGALERLAKPDVIRGVYIPFWTYDADTYSEYRGSRGDHYYETAWVNETDDEGNSRQVQTQVQRTRWFPTAGRVTNQFDDVLITATKALNTKRLQELEPWDLKEIKPYEPQFLSGFEAQRYQLPLQDGFELAKREMQGQIDSTVRQAIGGDEQTVDNIATNYMNIMFKHILLPVWVGAYRFDGRVFQVVVNARTAQVKGERPYSIGKIVLLVVAVILLLIVIISLASMGGGRHRYR